MREQIKLRAKECIRSQRGTSILIYFIYTLIVSGASLLISYLNGAEALFYGIANGMDFETILSSMGSFSSGNLIYTLLEVFVFLNLSVGFCGAFLRIWQRRETRLDDMFRLGFVPYWKKLGAMALVSVYTTLWTMLFVIPGIVKGFSYAMTQYILIEMPSVDANEAIGLSKRMMRGFKWKLFVLNLSFIGWDLLNALTFGILGVVFVEPYKAASKAGFYEMVRDNAIANGIIQPESNENKL